jgi:acetyl-CoA synthetase
VVAELTSRPDVSLNTAMESCGRWASDRGRLALIVCHPDGRADRWTYYELDRAAARAARVFSRAGLRRGDRLAAILTRQAEAFIAALAAWRSGLVYVPLFCGFGPDALAQRLRAADASAVVVDHRWRGVLSAACDQIERDLTMVTVAGAQGRGVQHGDWSFWAEMDSAAPDSPYVDTTADDPATLMFTSGTTSAPKGCVIPHGGLVSLLPFVQHCMDLSPSDLLFSTSDPGWSYGLYTTGCAPMALGRPRVIYTGDFDAAAWLRVIEDQDVTFVAGAPTAYRLLARAAGRHGLSPSVRGATSAGEPLNLDTVEAWRQLGAGEVLDGYGLTEVGMVLANLSNPPTEVVPGALASVVPGFEVDLVDEDGRVVPEGEIGQIAVHRPRFQLSIGYDNAPREWEERWVDNRFMTGDLARRDERGYWWYVGRADDIIVTAGYNVGPVEVETVLLEHPHVVEAAIVAASDPDRGSVVRAVVVAGPGAPRLDELTSQLQDAVRERVGRHAYPRVVDYVEALPRTETGKVRHAQLRAQS